MVSIPCVDLVSILSPEVIRVTIVWESRHRDEICAAWDGRVSGSYRLRNADVDRLRAVAISFVLLSHLRFVWQPQEVEWIFRWTEFYTGVDLFFVISGYIVSKTLATDLDHADSKRPAVIRFYLKRCFRILPLAYAWAAIPVVLSIVLARSGKFSPPQALLVEAAAVVGNVYNLVLGFGLFPAFSIPPFWSLSVEEQFYLALPAFLIFVPAWRARVVTLGGLVLLVTFVIRPMLVWLGASPALMNAFTFSRIDQIAIGVLIYLFSQTDTWRSYRPSWMHVPAVGPLLVITLIAALALPPGLFRHHLVVENAVYAMPIIGVAAGLLVWLASYDEDFILICSRIEQPMRWLGSRSYALYLVHWPMISIAAIMEESFGGGAVARTIYFLGFTLSATELSHEYIEQPMIEFGRRWISQRQANLVSPK